MSEWTVHLELEEGTSSKFWRARVEGRTLYVNYGKIGSTGQTQVKDFADSAAAHKEYDKLVRDKRKKGYVDTSGESAADAEDADEPRDDEAPAPPAPVVRGGSRMILEAGSRKVETHVHLDGKTVRTESVESYGSPEAAKKAYERIKKVLAGEGYKETP